MTETTQDPMKTTGLQSPPLMNGGVITGPPTTPMGLGECAVAPGEHLGMEAHALPIGAPHVQPLFRSGLSSDIGNLPSNHPQPPTHLPSTMMALGAMPYVLGDINFESLIFNFVRSGLIASLAGALFYCMGRLCYPSIARIIENHRMRRMRDIFEKAHAPELTALDARRLAYRAARHFKINPGFIRKILVDLIPHMASHDLLTFSLKLEARLGDANWCVHLIAALTLLDAIPHLNPQDRLNLALKLEARLGDAELYVRHAAFGILRDAIPHLNPEDRLARVLNIEECLGDAEWIVRITAVETLRRVIPHLNPEDRLARVLNIEECLGDAEWNVRRAAARTLGRVTPHLNPQDRLNLALKIGERLGDENNKVRNKAVQALGDTIPYLNPEDRLARVLNIEECLGDAKWRVRCAAVETLRNVIPHLNPEDRLARVLNIEECLGDAEWRVHQIAALTLLDAIPHLNPQDRLNLALKLEERLGDGNSDLRKQAKVTLNIFASSIKLSKRMALLRDILQQRGGLNGVNSSFIDTFCRHIPVAALEGFARKHGDPQIRILADYHAARMPFDEYFWPAYLAANDHKQYLADTHAQIAIYRRGALFAGRSDHELHMAYAGLDGPEKLTFEEFARNVRFKSPPPLFLNIGFTRDIALIESVHAAFDKGRLKEALSPIDSVSDAGAFKRYLADLVGHSNGEMKEARAIIEDAFPQNAADQDVHAIVEGTSRVLPKLWELWKSKKSRPLEEFLYHLIFLIAWHKDGETHPRNVMTAARADKVSSVALRDGLTAAEEFYRDAMEDVVRNIVQGNGDELTILKKQRGVLRDEIARAEKRAGGITRVEFIPSKSQTDFFFGYVGEDCTIYRGKSIYRDDFQVYRMISDERLVGMLYIQKAVLDGRKVLVMAIQPRSFWKVDYRNLLKIVEEEFSRIAEEVGYEAVLLVNDNHQQSNRLDMLAAIRERGYRAVKYRDSISGAIFSGNSFLAMWERK